MEKKRPCESCYTCEKGVAPTVTIEMFRQAQQEGRVPPEWLITGDCKACVACEKCYIQQDSGCEACFTCQKCYQGQVGVESGQQCDNCFSCEKCFTTQGSCGNCVSCEKGVAGQPAKVGQGQGETLTYFVFLTNDCNLRCDYCYATKTPPKMNKEVVDQVISFVTEIEDKRLPANRQISIQFFGGEPTIEWELMTYMMKTLQAKSLERYGRPVRWGMTTNCTLLNEERLKFLKEYNLIPLLSIDGPESIHNKHRKTVGGKGSFDLIDFDLILKYYPTPEVRPTIMPDTVEDFYDTLQWFYSKGVTAVATEVAYEADWTEEALAKANKMYNRLADLYIERKKAGKPMWMKFIEDGRAFLGADRQRGYVCGVARGLAAIDANGKLYACQRYASFSNPELAIGDVWAGYDVKKLEWTQNLKREDMFPDPSAGFDCETCPALWRCRGGCNAMNFQVNGDRRIILKNHCIFHRMWAEISLRALAATGELWSEMNKRRG